MSLKDLSAYGDQQRTIMILRANMLGFQKRLIFIAGIIFFCLQYGWIYWTAEKLIYFSIKLGVIFYESLNEVVLKCFDFMAILAVSFWYFCMARKTVKHENSDSAKRNEFLFKGRTS
ncbi:Oidioi.mRNA.OKI2018_I69.chr1.g1293.t1.cds [Oikopleura dioica]|uniref:Oidioi.mRNA.OKI2018_I69.chr1.g1293.t1.cds n=1 Tax=Oikopleura dioica TaxID=34765 RepID=A0ABN7SMG1_OIKDI|nr:Oidioi.mRNA.OKI2018_I69.chr1.g1293.t1.cds [Oikopleura dioica]